MQWLSIDTWLISIVAVSYLGLLFLLAYWAQNTPQKSLVSNPWVYSLSLGVSCTSWAFYGIVGQASTTGQWLAPIYIGTIAMMAFGWPLLLKLLRKTRQLNLSSIADFLATRYENRAGLAALVTLIVLLGTIPYIALQLRAMSQSFDIVTGTYRSGLSSTISITIILILFSILFGARTATLNRQNPGLVFTIAFSSIVKLLALTIIGLYVTFSLFNGFEDILSLSEDKLPHPIQTDGYTIAAQILLGALTVFTTPALYHMIIMENNRERDLEVARWAYPLYLIAINIFVLPIALAGQLSFGDSINADTYVLTIPLFYQQTWISVVVFVGGLAAAISIVVVAGIVLSNMIITDWITPLLVRYEISGRRLQMQLSKQLLQYRRVSIAVVLLLALLFERTVEQEHHLANIGVLAFVLLVQLAPSLIGAIYWRSSGSKGAIGGLMAGTLVWAYCILFPVLAPHSPTVEFGPLGISWLKPTGIFGITNLDVTVHGLFASLTINTLVFLSHSFFTKRSVAEEIQADIFVQTPNQRTSYALTYSDLLHLLRRFIDEAAANKMREHIPPGSSLHARAEPTFIESTHQQLSSILGSTSTKLVMSAATERDSSGLGLNQVANIVDEASQLFEFNRELLQAAVENIAQGIAVVDSDMRLVAWNKRYAELLEYPDGLLNVGMPVADLLQLNIERGIINENDPDNAIEKRLQFMRDGHVHHIQRELPSGKIIEIRGKPMPGGGFVSTYADISDYIKTQRALTEANENLEQRVQDRTQALMEATVKAEAANSSKTRFLTAASHDLMQPFNALSLFTDMLHQKIKGTELSQLTTQISQSLEHVEALLTDLIDISKLDSPEPATQLETFPLHEVMAPLANELNIIAQQKDVEFRYVPSSVLIHGDRKLIRRLAQNLVTNAVQYVSRGSKKPKVLLGVRRKKHVAQLIVIDNGPGIPEDKQEIIFKEFERLSKDAKHPGLGLGLAICERVATALGTKIELVSYEGEGSIFSVTFPIMEQNTPKEIAIKDAPKPSLDIRHLKVLIVDNDAFSLSALEQLLRAWQCDVITWDGNPPFPDYGTAGPDLVIADYHLDTDQNGIDLIISMGLSCPSIICSADSSEALRQACIDNNIGFIRKPIKPLSLKRLIMHLNQG